MKAIPPSGYERLRNAVREFPCCDTDFRIRASGLGASRAASAARETAEALEAQLNAFEEPSAVTRLNDNGVVRNEHVARIVHRGLEYYGRTNGVFNIGQGRFEHGLKAFLCGDSDAIPDSFDTGTVTIDGPRVSTDVPLDLNGLAKGYIVDQAAIALDRVGCRGFVSGGGDLSPPTGPVAVESPYSNEDSLRTLDTDWAIATTGGYRRERDGVDHVYNPTTERVGSRHESVTVVAERDCMEADAIATTLAALPLDLQNTEYGFSEQHLSR
jgi:thiamine biosynthesis lipoprotein